MLLIIIMVRNQILFHLPCIDTGIYHPSSWVWGHELKGQTFQLVWVLFYFIFCLQAFKYFSSLMDATNLPLLFNNVRSIFTLCVSNLCYRNKTRQKTHTNSLSLLFPMFAPYRFLLTPDYPSHSSAWLCSII